LRAFDTFDGITSATRTPSAAPKSEYATPVLPLVGGGGPRVQVCTSEAAAEAVGEAARDLSLLDMALIRARFMETLGGPNQSPQEANQRFLGMEPNALASWLVTELERAGVARRAERWLNIC